MTDSKGPFAVVATLDQEAIPITNEEYRLLIFDDVELAREFAFGLLAAGFESAKTYGVDELRLFDVLDEHDAPAPYAPEVEEWRDLQAADQLAEAYALGEILGGKWRAGMEKIR